MDKRNRIGGIVAAIILAILIWVSPSNPPPIPELLQNMVMNMYKF